MAVNAEEPVATKTITVKYIEWGEYHYFASFCLSFGYRERPTTAADVKVTKIWADGVLIYSLGAGDVQSYNAGVKFTVRPGTSNQLPVGGAELAYRDQLLIWFHDYDLGTGGSLPAFTAEFTDDTGSTLYDALEAFAVRAGFTEEDIVIDEALDYPIVGYIADGQSTLNTINTNLGFIYNFTGVEIAGQIVFKQSYDDNGDAVVQWTIGEEDLAVISETASDQQLDVIELAADQGVPRSITIGYYDVDFNFDKNTQTAARNLDTSGSETDVNVTLPIVAGAEEMRAFAQDALYRAWDQKNGHSLRLPRSYIGVDPGDVLQWTVGSETFTGEAQRVTVNADYSVSVSAAEIAVDFTPITTVPYQPPSTPVSTIVPDPVNAVVFDIPDWLSNQEQVGSLNLRVAMGGYEPGTWVGARFDMTRIDQPTGWAPRVQLGPTEEIGIAALAEAPTNWNGGEDVLDATTVLRVTLRNMPLARLTAGVGELVAVGKDGRFELLTYTTVTPINETTVELSGLYRGKFGTEDSVNQHDINDNISFVNDLKTITYSVDDYVNARTFFFRALPPLMPAKDADVKYFRPLGNSRRPYSPDNVVTKRTIEGDLIFTWSKDNRFAGEPDSIWSVEIYNEDWTILLQRLNNIIISDVAATEISWTYFLDYQFTNGINELTTINALVYQMNASHGVRGFPGGGDIVAQQQGILSATAVLELEAYGYMGQDIDLAASGLLALYATNARLTAGAEIFLLATNAVLTMSANADVLIGGLESAGVLLMEADASLTTIGVAPILREIEEGVQSAPDGGGNRRLDVDVPAGTVDGDLLVFFAEMLLIGGATSGSWPAVNVDDILKLGGGGGGAGGTWNYLHKVKLGTGNRLHHFVLAWRIADDEPNTYYWANRSAASLSVSSLIHRGGMMRFTNFREDTPIKSSGQQGVTTSTSTHTAPSVTGALNGLLYNVVWPVVQSWGSHYAGIGPAKPSDMEWVEYVAYENSRFDEMLVAEKLLASSLATGSKTYTPPYQTPGVPGQSAYQAFSFVVNAWPFISSSAVLELTASAELTVPVTVLLDSTGTLEMGSTANLTVIHNVNIEFVTNSTRQIPGSDTTSINMTIPTVADNDLMLAAILHSDTLTPPSGWKLVRAFNGDWEDGSTEGTVSFVQGASTRYLSLYERHAVAADSADVENWAQSVSGRIAGQIEVFRRDDGGKITINKVNKSKLDNTGTITSYPIVATTGQYNDQMWTGWLGMVTYNNVFVDQYVSPSGAFTYLPPSTAATADNRLIGAYEKIDDGEVFAPTFNQTFGVSAQGYGTIALLLSSDRKELAATGVLMLSSSADLTVVSPLLMDGDNVTMDGDQVVM